MVELLPSDGARVVLLDVEWATAGASRLRVGRRGIEGGQLFHATTTLRYRAESGTRFCCGWFDVSAGDRHVTCDGWRTITSGTQCARCRRKEGFLLAHRPEENWDRLPEHVRAYLSQAHSLYVAVFAGGATKVGTVARSRLSSRLAEQGALAALFVAEAEDGVTVRRAEQLLAARTGLRQAVRTREKVNGLGLRVDLASVATRLWETVDEMGPLIRDVAERAQLSVLDVPGEWRPPAETYEAAALTPLMPYAHRLSEGAHHLDTRAMIGSIAVFATSDDADARLFCQDLNGLRGYEISPEDDIEAVENMSLF